ncbi:iron-containing alcohol dehydrogenase [Nakamurella leprariae]|uniref:Iron-containing alcohol dehydrogenase n=1 Tax=Nakamurella leprariae TaxID=2803911 RepID=A0A938YD79_9ACTN|nr:iron-containing alcohol dehydrogenase [Nakamurella leprariae]MBM9467436.1 iron-containing alcohol dehydrogenase [Nakamurella leprariae]
MTLSSTVLPTADRSVNVLALGLLRQPATVLFGPGQRRQLPRLVAEIARHVLVVTDARMAASAEFTEMVSGLDAVGVRVSVFGETEPELPERDVAALVDRFAGQGIGAVVGLGGGSCMDLAKVAAVVLPSSADVREFHGEFRVPGPGLPIITVPTTGGTGAEVTCISVLFDEDKGMKVGVASPHLQARITVIDPEFTLSCPPGLTAATAADALSHLVESFTGRAKNPTADALAGTLYAGKNLLTDLFARHGLLLMSRSLPRLAADPQDLSARSEVMLAAYCAGMAINTAGTAGAHAIQSPIGALTHTPHGFGVSALLPAVMRYNLPSRVPEFAEIADILGVAVAGQDEQDQARSGILGIEALLETIGAPLDLASLGLPVEQFGFVADQALLATRLTANNPRPLTREAIMAILEHGHAGDRSWWG